MFQSRLPLPPPKTHPQFPPPAPYHLQAAREAANRWLDNQFALQSWCKRKFEGRGAELDAFFKDCGFDEEASYLE